MNRRASVLVLVLIAAAAVDSRPQDDRQKIIKCPPTSSCTCIEYSEVEIQCPRFEPRIFVRIQPNNYIHFDCENSTNNEHELLPEFKLDEAGLVEFIRCPLLHGKSVTTYLKNIHISRIRSFQFVSSGANQHIPIESEHFKGLGDIERFDLRGMENEIKDLPADLFSDMTKITWVRIRVANIQLPRDLFAPLVNLEFLELGHNKLKSLEPGFLRNQRKLKQLNLWGNSLRNLNKASFEGLDMVGELDLSGNGLESLESDVFFHLTNLTEINLSANNFASLPDGLFMNNRKLSNFKLLENRITLETLPDGLLANMTELEKVYIKCDLKNIPEDIFKGSANIKIIKLDYNLLSTLPKNLLADQSNLDTLDLSGNVITQLPDEIFLGLKSLKELRLSRNSLKVISK
jgi:protein toll